MSLSDRPTRPRRDTPKPALWENVTASPAAGQRSHCALFLPVALLAVGGIVVPLLALRSSSAPGAAPLEDAAHPLANMEEIASDLSVLADDPCLPTPTAASSSTWK